MNEYCFVLITNMFCTFIWLKEENPLPNMKGDQWHCFMKYNEEKKKNGDMRFVPMTVYDLHYYWKKSHTY